MLEWLGIIAAWIGTWIALYQIRDLKRTRKRQESPFFELGTLYIQNTQGFAWPDGGDVPVDYPEGSVVRLDVLNRGGEARNTEVISLTDLSLQVGESKRIAGDEALQIYYPYCKNRRDKIERFRISYETLSGEAGEQILEYTHGRRGLKRVKIA